MADAAATPERCGIDTVEIARIERLLAETPAAGLGAVQRRRSWPTPATGAGAPRASPRASRRRRPASSSSRARRRWAQIEPEDFSVARDNYGAPQVVCAPRAAGGARPAPDRADRAVADARPHERVGRRAGRAGDDRRCRSRAGCSTAAAVPPRRDPRRTCAASTARRVAEDEIVRLAQAHYAHLWRLAGEFLRFRWLSRASARPRWCASRTSTRSPTRSQQGKGVLVLTGHFGNWEVATVAGIGNYPAGARPLPLRAPRAQARAGSTRSSRGGSTRAGFGVLPKRGSLDAMLDTLAKGDIDRVPVRPARAARPTASTSTSSAIRRGRSRASRSSRSPPARRSCRRRRGASPTAATCCASRTPLPPVETRRHATRRSARRRAPTTRRSSG